MVRKFVHFLISMMADIFFAGTLAVIADLDGSHRGSADMSAWGVFASPPVVGAGSRVFVSLPSYSGIGVVSLTTAAAVSPPQAWLVKPCAEPGQLAIDAARSRLFVTCGASPSSPSQSVAVLDATPQGAGFRLATLPLGRGSCGLAFDAPSARLFASCAASPVVAVYQTQVGGTEDQYAMMGAFTVGAGSTGYIAVGRDPLGPPGAPPTVVTAAAVGVFDPTAPPAADGGGEWVRFFGGTRFWGGGEGGGANLDICCFFSRIRRPRASRIGTCSAPPGWSYPT